MATRYIYLSDELNFKLREEDNASGLISKLLNKHYEGSELTDEQIIDNVKKLIKAKEEKQANYDKFNNPEYKAKRLKKMEETKVELKEKNKLKPRNILEDGDN